MQREKSNHFEALIAHYVMDIVNCHPARRTEAYTVGSPTVLSKDRFQRAHIIHVLKGVSENPRKT
jgi:hypothetical protein